jgi:hypothetical protein
MTTTPDFEAFLSSWRESIVAGDPPTTELGRRFALKIVTQWLDAPESGMEIVYCDGAGDGGVDLAVLDVGPEDENEGQPGHTWYLVQSKHGTAFQGSRTLLVEAQKSGSPSSALKRRQTIALCWSSPPSVRSTPTRRRFWKTSAR